MDMILIASPTRAVRGKEPTMVSLLPRLRAISEIAPDTEALSIDEFSLSFQELLTEVTKLSDQLLDSKHLTPEGVFLPLVVGFDPESYISILASLQAGIPIALIDSTAPSAKVRNLLPLCGAAEAVDPSDFVHRKVTTHQIWKDAHPSSYLLRERSGLSPILGIFTSGTTGVPKMVAFDDSAVDFRLGLKRREVSHLGIGSRSNTFSPPSASAGFSVLGDVLEGLSLNVMDYRNMSPRKMVSTLFLQTFDVLRVPTTVMRLLRNYPPGETELFRARLIKLGVGEAVSKEDFLHLSRFLGPQAVIRHNLSSSEAGEMFRWEASPETDFLDARVPIGNLVSTRNIHLEEFLGGEDNLFEVLVDGPSLALGYISESPGRNGFFVREGKRAWRSGDIVRQVSPKCFLHYGRVDDLIKVGGRRVSPKSIDNTLLSVPAVTDSVTIQAQPNGELVTHVEVVEKSKRVFDTIRTTLSQELEPYMVPTRIVLHLSFPRTIRGKVNRQELLGMTSKRREGILHQEIGNRFGP